MVTSILSQEGGSLSDFKELPATDVPQQVSFDPSTITIQQWLITLLKFNVAALVIWLPLAFVVALIAYAVNN